MTTARVSSGGASQRASGVGALTRALPRARLLPLLLGAMVLLACAKLEALLRDLMGATPALPWVELVAPAQAVAVAAAETKPAETKPAETKPAEPKPADAAPAGGAQPGKAAPAAAPAAEQPLLPEAVAAERALLEGLRARRTEIEAREQALAEREMLLTAAERRLSQRIEELTALQKRLESAEKTATEREESGWRQLVKLYEGMRPRDAAAIFDALEMAVLVEIVDRMGQRKAAPVLGAMRPDRARELTTELARHRARTVD